MNFSFSRNKFFHKLFFLAFVFCTFFSTTAHADLFGYNAKDEARGCPSSDRYLPTLVICGRNPSSGACSAFTQQCNLGDLVETGSRAIVWLISITLLIVPLLVMYYGAMIIWEQKWDGNISQIQKLKNNFKRIFLYFIFMLAAWLIVRTVVDIFQVEDRVPSFLIDENGNQIKARTFNTQ
jgi:hypothetical protein